MSSFRKWCFILLTLSSLTFPLNADYEPLFGVVKNGQSSLFLTKAKGEKKYQFVLKEGDHDSLLGFSFETKNLLEKFLGDLDRSEKEKGKEAFSFGSFFPVTSLFRAHRSPDGKDRKWYYPFSVAVDLLVGIPTGTYNMFKIGMNRANTPYLRKALKIIIAESDIKEKHISQLTFKRLVTFAKGHREKTHPMVGG